MVKVPLISVVPVFPLTVAYALPSVPSKPMLFDMDRIFVQSGSYVVDTLADDVMPKPIHITIVISRINSLFIFSPLDNFREVLLLSTYKYKRAARKLQKMPNLYIFSHLGIFDKLVV
jgi:hypothetical protein